MERILQKGGHVGNSDIQNERYGAAGLLSFIVPLLIGCHTGRGITRHPLRKS